MSLESAQRIGPYRIVSTLGRGGTGIVFLAERDGARFALKCMHDFVRAEPELRARFVREGRLTASLQHPNLVRVHELAEAPEVGPYLVMEELRGVTLARALDLGASVPLPVAHAILVALFAALAALHEVPAGSIVHGDLSPQNLMVGFDGRVKLIDLGLARADHATRVTRSEKLRGKLRYLAPEQLQATPKPTVASDQYAAGVIAWELLTGRRLIEGTDNRMRVARILAGSHALPSSVRPEIPAALDAAVTRALAPDPALRFGSVRALSASLNGLALAPEAEVGAWIRAAFPELLAPVSADPAPAPARALGSRWRASVAVLLAAAVAGTLLGSSSTPVTAPQAGSAVARRDSPSVEPAAPVQSHAALPPELAPPSRVPSAAAASSGPVGSVAPARRHRSPRAAASCAVPFSFDAHGNKTYRPGCL